MPCRLLPPLVRHKGGGICPSLPAHNRPNTQVLTTAPTLYTISTPKPKPRPPRITSPAPTPTYMPAATATPTPARRPHPHLGNEGHGAGQSHQDQLVVRHGVVARVAIVLHRLARVLVQQPLHGRLVAEIDDLRDKEVLVLWWKRKGGGERGRSVRRHVGVRRGVTGGIGRCGGGTCKCWVQDAGGYSAIVVALYLHRPSRRRTHNPSMHDASDC